MIDWKANSMMGMKLLVTQIVPVAQIVPVTPVRVIVILTQIVQKVLQRDPTDCHNIPRDRNPSQDPHMTRKVDLDPLRTTSNKLPVPNPYMTDPIPDLHLTTSREDLPHHTGDPTPDRPGCAGLLHRG